MEIFSVINSEPDRYIQNTAVLLKNLVLNLQIRREFNVERLVIYQRTIFDLFDQ